MDEKPVEWDLIMEEVHEPGKARKRIGRLRSSGKIGLEISLDDRGREVEKIFYDDDGKLAQRVIYEHDNERKPTRTLVYDAAGKLIWRQERGKRPEDFSGAR